MSDFELLDSEKLNLQLNDGENSNNSTLVQINPNMNFQSPNSSAAFEAEQKKEQESVDGGSRKSGGKKSGVSGGTKVGPKPSSALLEAKRIALLRKRSSGEGLPVIIKDHLQPARDSKDIVRKETGVVYDLRMVEHSNPWDPSHPESPKRFSSIIQRCHELGLLERCLSIPPRYAKLPELLALHTPEHISSLYDICHNNGEDIEKLEEIASKYDSVYFHRTTNELALLSCGSTIDLVKAVAEGNVQNGMAIVRPPGHHAMEDEFCGYCFFNNVAVAAKQVLESNLVKRVLIIDYDVHHGQATQQMFYDDPRVLYFSTHRFEHGTYWPNLEESDYSWIGAGEGIGYNCNIPLNKIGMGNTEFLTVWHQVLLPLAYKFNPDLVIVSAGYDAALGCPEFNPELVLVSAGYDAAIGDTKGEMKVAPQCYPHLIQPLMGLANGKVAVILEGGYCLKSLAEGAALTLRTLLGDPSPLIPPTSTPLDEITSTILDATTVLRKSWNIGTSRFLENEEFQIELENGNAHLPQSRFDWNTPKPERYLTRDCHPIQGLDLILDLDKQLDALCANTSLAVAKHRVGLLYDVVMLGHRNMFDPIHPERPERISDIFACHVDYGLVERCHRIEPREATHDELKLIHTEEHILKMQNTTRLKGEDLENLQSRFNSVYFNKSSYSAALNSAGSVLQAVDSVLTGECQSVVAIVRPPGHHAETQEPCGFCLFNNVALAAKYAIEKHHLKRILIVDWDVHHGNGIQHMFEDDPRVLYVSLHRYDHGAFFPGKKDADFDVVGRGDGKGFNVNIPWNGHRMGDTEYLAAFTNIILPIAYEYGPELVLVSAGFDAAQGDPLGGYKVTPEGYAHMTNLLSPLANGRIILALEGGYNLTSIAYSMTLCTKTLLGDPIPMVTLKENIAETALESIRNVLDVHSNFWTVLKPFRKSLPINCPVPLGKYPSKKLSEDEDLVKQMEKLGVEATVDESDSLNGNTPPAVGFVIPDTPPASGEPSLSLPNSRPNTGRVTPNNNPEFVVDSNTIGGGENATAPPLPANQPNPGTEQAVVGAAGGTDQPETIENLYRVMTNRDIEADDGRLVITFPLSWCPHLESVSPAPTGGIDVTRPCETCANVGENWICLTCYRVFCSRFVQGHMVDHSTETGHQLCLSFSDLSVWCYACNDYIDSPALHEAKSAAHQSKFSQPMNTAGGAA